MKKLRLAVPCALLLSLTTARGAAGNSSPLKSLEAWSGKYPFDLVRGRDFWSTPGLPEAITAAVGPAEYKILMDFTKRGPSGVIGVLDGNVFVDACRQHDCHDERFELIVAVASGQVYACRATSALRARRSVRWSAAGRTVEVKGECGASGTKDAAGLRAFASAIPNELKPPGAR